jgi:hypothetical protein
VHQRAAICSCPEGAWKAPLPRVAAWDSKRKTVNDKAGACLFPSCRDVVSGDCAISEGHIVSAHTSRVPV